LVFNDARGDYTTIRITPDRHALQAKSDRDGLVISRFAARCWVCRGGPVARRGVRRFQVYGDIDVASQRTRPAHPPVGVLPLVVEYEH
jgi:hypothetical protein